MATQEGDQLTAKIQAMPSYGAGEDPMAGLSSRDAAKLLEEYGPNELDPQAQDSFLKILVSQMCNLIFLLTSSASLICYLTGDEIKGTFLIVLVCVVCTCNAIGEWSSQDASAALKAMNPESAKVMRDGQLDKNFAIENMVPGDIVHLTIGDTIPADMELLKCTDLQTSEAVLTGEPNEVNKSVVPKEGGDSAFPTNMLYKSTDIVAGAEIVARVTATGMRTQVGLIAKRLKPKDDSIAKKISPLQVSINVLGSIIGAVCAVVICFGTAASIGLEYRALPPACAASDSSCLYYTSVVRGLLMAVAIIPHGLPLVVMVMLRVASKQMMDKNAVVTKQSAVDYLGAAHYICTDKTGTLTEGKMAAKLLVGFTRAQEGAINPTTMAFYPMKGLDPTGSVYPALELTAQRCTELNKPNPDWAKLKGLHNLISDSSDEMLSAHLARTSVAAACINCHGTRVFKKGSAWAIEGNMSEGALKVASMKGGYTDDSEAGQHLMLENVREAELEVPFTSKRKMSATVHHLMQGQNLSSLQFDAGITHYAILKGAPDRVVPYIGAVLQATKDGTTLAKEPATAEDRAVIEKQNGQLAKQALRSLVMAVRPLTADEVGKLRGMESADDRLSLILGPEGQPGPLAVLGLWGIFDPPRSSVPPSIQQCHDAGIEVVMITGDQRDTALAIANLVGITKPAAHRSGSGRPLGDNEVAKKCTELHHEKPHIIRKMSEQNVGGSPGGGMVTKQRSLRVHDEKTEADSHEQEYKDDAELAELTSTVRVWSRAQPSDKVCIVDSLCQQTYITAMTGDGVNDAPALKGADIGTAMGIAGTAVTRNSADLILKDDNFSTIVAAVAEGRKIYGNLQKYVVFNLSAKAGECICVMTAILFGLALPVQGLQQLVNMVVTHIIPPMALAWEDAEWYSMLVPPRDTKNDLVLNRTHMIFRWLPFILCFGCVIMTNVCYGVWMHTGFVTVQALVGTSVAGALDRDEVACQLGGHLNAAGDFVEDPAPYHCRCTVRSAPWQSMESATVVNQWGRSDEPVIHMNRWTGNVGNIWDKSNTPFAGNSGESDLLEHCTDNDGLRHMCWKNPDADRPLLDSHKNCAIYGGQAGETMGYVSVQVGEVLALMTYRSDGPVWHARTSWVYFGVLAFNLSALMIVLYVPAASELLELYPLSLSKLMLSLIAPIALVFISEIIKVGYRHQLAVQHALLGIHETDPDEIGKP